MKKMHFVFLFCILVACTKSSVDTPEPRLLSITTTSTANSNVFTININYDTEGKIISLSEKSNSGTLNSTISYLNKEILIYPGVNANLKEVREVKYTVNSNGLPLKRIEYNYLDFNGVGVNRKTKYYDTSFFEYSPAFALSRITKNQLDTTSYTPPGSPTEYSESAHLITTAFNNENNLLKGSVQTDLVSTITKVGVNTYVAKSSNERITAYTYLKDYSNQIDYSNFTVMNECLRIFEQGEFFGKSYKNLPDKITTRHVWKDANGNIVNSFDYMVPIELEYNSSGYLSVLKRIETGYITTKTFVYNK